MRKSLLFLLVAVSLLLFAGCGKEADVTAPSPEAAPQTDTPSGQYPEEASDDYPHDIESDKLTFDFKNIDIVVGDKLYMTQINDWYINPGDYMGKSVEIEGYYMVFDKYTFVGRKGPSCPYCTGGYVNFEFQSNEDLSSLVSESSWVRVTGILREGALYPGSGEAPQSFYYIEAMAIETLPEVGIDTVVD